MQDGREPVGLILAALEAQTSSLYRLSVVATKQGQDKFQSDIRRVAEVLKKLLAAAGPPTATELVAKVAALQVQLDEIGAQTRTRGAMPIPFVFGPGKPAYDALAHAQAEVFVQAIRASADKYAELVARQNAYYELLKKYVATLRQTARALEFMEASLARPVDLRAEANQLLKVDSSCATRWPLTAVNRAALPRRSAGRARPLRQGSRFDGEQACRSTPTPWTC